MPNLLTDVIPYDGPSYNPYEELASAIILQAIKDYVDPNCKIGERRKIATFFKSRYFSILMPNINGEQLLNRIKKELVTI